MATSADTKPDLARPRRSAAPTALSRRIWGLADPLLDPRGCLFIFHRAAPHAEWDGLPNREFYLDLDFLDRMLTHLVASGWAIVTLDEAIERMADPGRMRRFVNFSVDDCYRDTFEHVVPLFRRHGVPVTLFVTTGIPDGTLPLWAAGLEEALRTRDSVLLPEGPLGVATPEAKREAFGRLAREWDGSQAGARYTEFCRLNGIDEADMHLRHAISWEMLEALRDDPLVEIGGHTVSHARIAGLDSGAAYAELAGCRERLRERLGCDARHFAFPYGRRGDCGPRDFELARKAGFTSSATTRKGVVRAGQEAWTLPRNTLNGAHRNLLITEAHLSGATGVAGRILGHV